MPAEKRCDHPGGTRPAQRRSKPAIQAVFDERRDPAADVVGSRRRAWREPTLRDPTRDGADPPRDGLVAAASRIAAAMFSAPFAGLSDGAGGWHSAFEVGAPGGLPRDAALRSMAIPSAGLLIADVSADPRLNGGGAAGGPRLRFYAGVPVAMGPGRPGAVLCVADVRPRPEFGDGRLRHIRDVAAAIEAHLHLRSALEACATEAELLAVTLDGMDQGVIVTDAEDRIRVHNGRVADLIGVPEALLADGAPFDGLRAFQAGRGEFAGLPADLRRWLETGDPRLRVPVYERECANGTVVEVRSVPMRHGGTVRTHTDVTARRAAERAALDGERRYRLIAENASDVIVLCDLDLERLYVSPAASAVLGREPCELVGRHPADLVHPEDVDRYLGICREVREGRVARALTTQRYMHRDGRWVWLEVSLALTRRPSDGAPDGFVATLRDVGARMAAEEALRASEARLRVSEERLALALDSGDDGVFDVDVEKGTSWTSGRWLRRLGLDATVGRGESAPWPGDMHPDDRDGFRREWQAHLDGARAGLEHEHRLRTADGGYVWTLTRARVTARGEDGRPLRVVGTHIDVSRRKEAEARVRHMAEHDALTGLPNRYRFRRSLGRAIDRAAEVPDRQAVLACDLDGFKAVNDTLGHVAGDRLLCVAAERLRTAVGDGDVVARLGGDEFAVILGDVVDRPAAEAACARIIGSLAAPIVVDGTAVHVGVSVGAAIVSDDGADADEVFKRADMALYEAKAAGRGTFRLHDAGVQARAASRSLIALDMPEAIRRGDFSLAYQPVVDVVTGSVTSFEALMRWHHPDRGAISPVDFIPVAEEGGAIVSLGAWALVEACREAATWPEEVRVAVNVSPVQFQHDLAGMVSGALLGSGLAPGRLVIEVTEGALMRDPDRAREILQAIRRTGVRVALDDFGTGYSSLAYIRRFPFDKLKIDRSFVRDIEDPDAAAMMRAVIGIGERLGMTVVVEGVETVEQLDLVRREGGKQVQGFLFSRPLPPAEARAYLTREGSKTVLGRPNGSDPSADPPPLKP